MSVITSFFPGHIRLRCPILKDVDIANAAIKAIESIGFSFDFKHNPQTGSILVEYDPTQVEIDKIEKLRPMLSELVKLKPLILCYDAKDKEFILAKIEKLSKEASERLS